MINVPLVEDYCPHVPHIYSAHSIFDALFRP